MIRKNQKVRITDMTTSAANAVGTVEKIDGRRVRVVFESGYAAWFPRIHCEPQEA